MDINEEKRQISTELALLFADQIIETLKTEETLRYCLRMTHPHLPEDEMVDAIVSKIKDTAKASKEYRAFQDQMESFVKNAIDSGILGVKPN